MTGRDNPPASAKRSSLLPGEVVLSLRGACLGFGDRTLWDGLDLDVRAGELVAVLGANGSGKSGVFPKKWRRDLCREFVDVSES